MGDPYRGNQKPEQIKFFWNYVNLRTLEDEVNEWLQERGITIDVIACEFYMGRYVLIRYRERE